MMKKFIFNILILFTAFTGLSAQNVYVKAELDTNYILIGDQVGLRITAICPEKVRVLFPVLKDTIMSKIEIVSLLSSDSVKSGNNFQYSRYYMITSFDSGQYFIPELPFVFQYPEGFADTMKTYSLELLVSNQLNDTSSAPYDIKEPLKVPLTVQEIIKYVALFFFIAQVIGLIILFWVLSRKKKSLFKFEKPKEAPHIVALRDLDNLKAQKLWQQGNIKEYYSRLTDILRLYIEDRYFIPALESTTDEIIDELTKIRVLENDLMIRLKTMLQDADLVKFAKMQPLPDENDNVWSFSYDFVLKTKAEVQNKSTETEAQTTKDGEGAQ